MIQLLQATVTANQSIMVKDGKIFLVMTIVSIILIGLFAYWIILLLNCWVLKSRP